METKIKVFLTFVLFNFVTICFGQIVNQNVINGATIKNGAVVNLIDNDPVSNLYSGVPSYDNLMIIEVDKSAFNSVPFYQNKSWDADFNLEIRYYTSSSAFSKEIKKYRLSFDATKPNAPNLLKIVEKLSPPTNSFKNKIEVFVNSLTISPSNFGSMNNAFSISLKYQRKGVLNQDFRNAFLTQPATFLSQGVFGLNNLTMLFPSADELDIEWAHIDEKSSFYSQNVNLLVNNANSSAWNSKFLNFSRTTVPFNTLLVKLPAIYNKGYIIYRVRQVYFDANGRRITGAWVESFSNILNKIEVKSHHSASLNWTSSITFAEEGKHKDVVTYFDGAQRDRQSVTYDNSSEKPIIAETYYDVEGRKSAAILPAPHLSSSEIKYYPNFNVEELSLEPYDAQNFSYLPLCNTAPKKLSSTSGASMYYSTSNTLKNQKYNQFIPDASGYPLTISEYTNDNTGRIKRQTGVGEEFQFHKDKFTEYLYGKPSEAELDRLFGTDVGNASHYFKNTVIDPNGQQSITYTDLSGKTIATALEGSATNTSLKDLTNNNGKNSILDLKLIKPEDMRANPQSALNYGNATLIVPYNQVVTFTIDNAASQFSNSNCKTSFCSDCYYNIDLTVKDNCGTNINSFNYKNYDPTTLSNKIDTNCNTFLKTINKVESVALNKGENYVDINVKIPNEVIDFYEKRYLESDLCITSLDSLIKKHRLTINPMNCIRNCQECLDIYGDEESYKNQILNQLASSGIVITDSMVSLAKKTAKDAKKRCELFCEGQNECSAKKEILYADISPGGQYGLKYYKDNEPPVYGIDDKLHILHNLNNSPFKKPSGLSWNFPNRNQSYPVKATTNPDIDTLIDLWNDDIADYLVKFHPEYCYYEYCSNNSNYFEFINEMDKVETWSEAVSKGYIQPGADPNDFAINIAKTLDPYFMTGMGASRLGEMEDRLRYYDIGPMKYNIFELAVLMTSPELYDKETKTVDITLFKDITSTNCTGQKDAAWLVFRNYYKQVSNEIFEEDREAYVSANNPKCISVNDIGVCTFNKSIEGLSWWMRSALIRRTTNATQESYCWKTARFQNMNTYSQALRVKLMAGTGSVDQEKSKSKDSLRIFCDTICINTAEGWLNSLAYCPELSDKSDPKVVDKIAKIKAGLIAVCRSSCGEIEYPNGASSVSPKDTNTKKQVDNTIKILLPGIDGGWVGTFQDVIELYIPSSKLSAPNSTAGLCNASFIDYPKPYGIAPHFEPKKIITKVDSCSCDRLAAEQASFDINPKGATDLYSYLKNKYKNIKDPNMLSEDFHMSEDHFNILVQSCKDRTCQYLPEEIELPYIFECYNKINCDVFNSAKNQFITEFKVIDPDPKNRLVDTLDPQYNKLWAGYLNNKLRINASYLEYKSFELKCDFCPSNCGITEYIKKFTVDNNLKNSFLTQSDFDNIAKNYNTSNKTSFNADYFLTAFLTLRRMDCFELNKFYTEVAIPKGGIFNTATKKINSIFKTEFDNYFKTKLANDLIEKIFTKCNIEKKEVVNTNCDFYMFSKPFSPYTDYKPDDSSCARIMDSLAVSAALAEYHKLRQESLNDFKNKYISHCLSAANTSLKAMVQKNEFHYTLYYYGQDGNLLATVPPAGVVPLDPTQVVKVGANRISGIPQPANHVMKTTYEYNSMNQVVRQNTPDGGSTRFLYDQMGRLLLSQNAEQLAFDSKVSYTKYDNLGRIIESGEIVSKTMALDHLFNLDYMNYSDFISWLDQRKRWEHFNFVTRTYYDKLSPISSQNLQTKFGSIQQNLRHRISSITLDEKDVDKNENTYTTALHYSYDVLGNVKTLVSENNVIPATISNQKYKTINYDYDLVSGKVNKVQYQKDAKDQFIYKYTYDAENRIQLLLSSKDDIVYNVEAQYEYYLHGPLARVIYGEDNVQGVDYAYTLQGWLKAVNASTLDPAFDMGKDGDLSLTSNINAKTARDAIAFSLKYYQNDFKQIARTSQTVEAKLPTTGFANNSLFNGNISSAIVSLKGLESQGYHYTYDQLNRIVGYDVFRTKNALGNDYSLATPTNDYKETVKYDPNGNILSYFRNKDAATSSSISNMDNLTYVYYHVDKTTGAKTTTPTNNTTPTNQLAQVKDAVQDGAYDLDIDNQTNTQNYKYDAIGNLIRDEQENMDISWTPTGKIAKIVQNKKKKMLTFAYDPMGNRISKTVEDLLGRKKPFTTYYTKDAQGNTMAVYDNHFFDKALFNCIVDRSQVQEAMDNITRWEQNCAGNRDPLCKDNEYQAYQRQLNDSCKIKIQAYAYTQFIPCALTSPSIDMLGQLYNQDHDNYIQLDAGAQEDYLNRKEQELAAQINDPMECFKKQLQFVLSLDNSQKDDYLNAMYNGTENEWAGNGILERLQNQQLTYNRILDTNFTDSIYWKEQYLYGSSRIGVTTPKIEVSKSNVPDQTWIKQYKKATTQYELTNHLGNVLATIKDEKQQVDLNKDGLTDYYDPILLTATDYYPFGMPMPGRQLLKSNCQFESKIYMGYKLYDSFLAPDITWDITGIPQAVKVVQGEMEVQQGVTLLPTFSKDYTLAKKNYKFRFEIPYSSEPLSMIGRYIRYEILPVNTSSPIYTGETVATTNEVLLNIATAGTYTVRYYLINTTTNESTLKLDIDNIAFDAIDIEDRFATTATMGWTATAATGTIINPIAVSNGALQISRRSGTGLITVRRAATGLVVNKVYRVNLKLLRDAIVCKDANSITVGVKATATATTYLASQVITWNASMGNTVDVALNFTATVATPVLEILNQGTTTNVCGGFQIDDVEWIQKDNILDNFATAGNVSSYVSTTVGLSNTNQRLQVQYPMATVVNKIYNLSAADKELRFDIQGGTCAPLNTTDRYIQYDLITNANNTVLATGKASGGTVSIPLSIAQTTAAPYTLRLTWISSKVMDCTFELDNVQTRTVVFNDDFAANVAGWSASANSSTSRTTAGQLQHSKLASSSITSMILSRPLNTLVAGNYTLTLNAQLQNTCTTIPKNATLNIKQGTTLLKTQPLSLTNSNTAFTINFTTTAASAAYTLEIVTPVASATTVSPCNTIWVDNVNLSQTYKVLDNFATLGNTSSYAATNATLGNTNGTLQTTLGTKPTVAKTYSALIVGTHFLSFEVDAGTCAPLALNTRHIVYEVLNATNAVVYSGTTAGSVSGVAIPIPAAGNYTLRYSLFKSSTEPLACQLMLDNIRWDRRVVADEFATLTGWTSSTANQLALLNQTLQIKNTQRATRTLALTANKNYNLSLTILKGTTCSASTVTVRIKNGTAIVAQTPITISASSAASIPVSFNFVSPVASPTLEIERTNFNTTSCSALQIDNVYITEKDWVNETFATIGNTSGYASSMPNTLALTNTAQQLQLNYIAPSRGMGVSKKVTLDKDQKYTINYSFKNKMGISANNFVILELIKDGSIMYTRKLQATEATTFDYTAPATGEYTWRMRSSSIGTTTTQPITYSLDNLSIFYSYPYTVENCDNLADGYRFGFNTQEKDDEIYGEGNLNTAMFWEYDTRLGRRWNVDPIYNAWESRYAVNGNNPNYFSDPLGNYKTKLGAKIANFFSKDKGEVLQAKTGEHKGEWFRGVADKDNGGHITRVFGGRNSSSKVDKVIDFAEHSKFSNSEDVTISLGIQIGASASVNNVKLNLEGGLMTRDYFKASLNPMADKNLANAEFLSENKMHNFGQIMVGQEGSNYQVGGKLDYNFLYYNGYDGLRMEEGTGKLDWKLNLFKYSFGPKLKIAPPNMAAGMSSNIAIDNGKQFYGLELGIGAKLILGVDYKMRFGFKY